MVRVIQILVSAVCGLLVVVFVALWVRSYLIVDQISGMRGPQFYYFAAYKGTVGLSSLTPNMPQQITWSHFTEPIDSRKSLFTEGPGYRIRWLPGLRIARFGNGFHLAISLWLLTLLVTTVAALVWLPIKKRFSLRTFLIATTIVAFAFGLLVWFVSG